MLQRSFPTLVSAWHGIIDELAYKYQGIDTVGQGGITTSYADGIVIDIKDALKDESLHLSMSSYTKGRWNQFLKRYFREDLDSWVESRARELCELNKHQVASYQVNYNPPQIVSGRAGYGHSQGGHRHGPCLSSLQLQCNPKPKVILFSRASQIDKAGFLDLALIHLVAKRTGWWKCGATWVISMAFIAAVSQMYYVRRFKKPLKGHSLESNTRRFWHDDFQDAKYGPQRRSIKKAQEFLRTGEIPRSCSVCDLTLTSAWEKANKKRSRSVEIPFDPDDAIEVIV